MVKESKEVYKAMDKVVSQYGNSLITPDNLRAELEQEDGELEKGPHYIVAAYPRPGAILTHIVIQYIKRLQTQTGSRRIDSRHLKSLVTDLFMNAHQLLQRPAIPQVGEKSAQFARRSVNIE